MQELLVLGIQMMSLGPSLLHYEVASLSGRLSLRGGRAEHRKLLVLIIHTVNDYREKGEALFTFVYRLNTKRALGHVPTFGSSL